MEPLILLLVGLLVLWWLVVERRQKHGKLSRDEVGRMAAEVWRSKQRQEALAWEADECAASLKLPSSLPYEVRDLVSDFDLIAKGINPKTVVNVLEPRQEFSATARDGTQVVVRYYEKRDVDDAIDADILALSEAWADGVVRKYQAAKRVEKERIGQEEREYEAERQTKADTIRDRVAAAKSKLRDDSTN